jgi:hypothetical protein
VSGCLCLCAYICVCMDRYVYVQGNSVLLYVCIYKLMCVFWCDICASVRVRVRARA